jgi:hypothetical protein
MAPQTEEQVFEKEVIPTLVHLWLADYYASGCGSDIVETTPDTFSYLFDVTRGRLIAAWGISKGRHGGERDKSRMSGHPKGGGFRYHRGHAIPHTLGGPTDINIVPQLGNVNIGAFRRLEIEAIKTPGSLYFTYWIYPPGRGQMPIRVEQGLLAPGSEPRITTHRN